MAEITVDRAVRPTIGPLTNQIYGKGNDEFVYRQECPTRKTVTQYPNQIWNSSSHDERPGVVAALPTA
jgi:hypothetical protein